MYALGRHRIPVLNVTGSIFSGCYSDLQQVQMDLILSDLPRNAICPSTSIMSQARRSDFQYPLFGFSSNLRCLLTHYSLNFQRAQPDDTNRFCSLSLRLLISHMIINQALQSTIFHNTRIDREICRDLIVRFTVLEKLKGEIFFLNLGTLSSRIHHTPESSRRRAALEGDQRSQDFRESDMFIVPEWLFDECAKPVQESAIVSEVSKKSKFFLPQWFLDERVRTAKELEDGDLLIINNETPVKAADSKEPQCLEEHAYQVQDVVYEPLSKVFMSPSTSYETASDPKNIKYFTANAVYLRRPDKHKGTGGIRFLTAVVKRFAKDTQADLITLGIDDVVDLTELFRESQAGLGEESADKVSSKLSKSHTGEKQV